MNKAITKRVIKRLELNITPETIGQIANLYIQYCDEYDYDMSIFDNIDWLFDWQTRNGTPADVVLNNLLSDVTHLEEKWDIDLSDKARDITSAYFQWRD
uniref:Uncharacterized protein n=1 Tax=Dulem virus 42 TaxID=3145760 RepID=A0AAU8B817_9CAUD